MTEGTITLHYTQRFGAADRIMSLLRRRGFPIGGITIERTHQEDVGRMTVVVQHAAAMEQVRRHLGKLPDVIEVRATNGNAVCREYALVRIRCGPQQRPDVMAVLERLGARAISETAGHLVVEASGPSDALDALFTELAPYGIEESARTSPVALEAVSYQPSAISSNLSTQAQKGDQPAADR